MRGRDRLAFRSKLGFVCVPGVVEVLVLPVKMNGPLGFRKKLFNYVIKLNLYSLHMSKFRYHSKDLRLKYLEFLWQRKLKS